MAPNRRRHCAGGESAGKALLPLLLLALINPQPSSAHFILIDHDEFRAPSGYHRPLPLPQPLPLPPPPLSSVDQLAQHLPARELSPAELMVDLTNSLTYRILHYHSILNRNNFAFSPTALMSVLVALYEGSIGRSATELRNVLQLPSNRDVIRVGYRDIHRRLRTYFFGSENPLKGLSLNKENVTITHDYEAVLMFYGYDLGMDMVSSTTRPTTTTTPTSTTAAVDSAITTAQPETNNTTEMKITKETTVEATTATPSTTTTTTTEMSSSTSTTTTTTTTATTTTQAASSEESMAATTTTEETATAVETTTPEEATTVKEESATVEAPEVTTVAPTAPAAGENEAAELVSPIVGEASLAAPFQRLQKSRGSHPPSGKLQAPPAPASSSVSLKLNYLPQPMRNGRYSRHKRHLLDVKELDAGLFVNIFNTPPQAHHNLFSFSAPVSGPALTPVHNDFETETIEPHFAHTSSSKQNYGYNTDVISHVFYLDNQQLVHTTFKVYNAVLYFKYFEQLKMSVLELELDTSEYNLMILLPDYQMDLVSAAASLRSGPPLRLMRRQLKPRWVQAIIPDFKLHGLMFLTNDLQNMGICDVFEPNRADFRPMTDEKGIYVKHIEQSINVNIRTRPINHLKRNYGAQTQPIQISVNHPFFFFVVDRDLDVAVMAGRIINPLNVRIQ